MNEVAEATALARGKRGKRGKIRAWIDIIQAAKMNAVEDGWDD